MLQGFRQHGFALHGSVMALLLGSLLLAALAPCIAHANSMDAATSHESMHAAMAGMEHGCPHCADSETGCFPQLVEASQPVVPSILSSPVFKAAENRDDLSDLGKLLPAVAAHLTFPTASDLPAIFPAVRPAAIPKHSATRRFCRFLE